MTDLIPVRVKNFIDTIFQAPLSFLEMIQDMLNDVSLVVGRGINLNNYFGFFGYLPGPLQAVVQSALASVMLLAIIFLIKSLWNVYLNVKGSFKWW